MNLLRRRAVVLLWLSSVSALFITAEQVSAQEQAIIFRETFDSMTPPGLPAGWRSSQARNAGNQRFLHDVFESLFRSERCTGDKCDNRAVAGLSGYRLRTRGSGTPWVFGPQVGYVRCRRRGGGVAGQRVVLSALCRNCAKSPRGRYVSGMRDHAATGLRECCSRVVSLAYSP